jgi:hypothetical protein
LAEALNWDVEALGWPPLGHLALFLPPPGPRGPDGHPFRGGFFPPVSLPRRMFASAEYSFHRPLIAGMPAMQMSSSLFQAPTGGLDHTYLEVAAAVPTFILLGRYLEARAKKATGEGWKVLDRAPDVPPQAGDELTS